jgi:hypothetical protein
MGEFTLVTYIGGAIIATFVGVLTGIFGVGGGFLITPALMILLGVPGPVAVGTSLPTILLNSSYGIFKRRGSNTIDIKLALSMAGGSIMGVLIGVFLIMEPLKEMEAITILGKQQNPVEYTLLCLFLVLLVWITLSFVLDVRKNRSSEGSHSHSLLAKVKFPPYINFTSLEHPRIPLIPILLLGCGIGILTGLLGVGGGVVILPVLIYLVGQKAAKAAGTSLLLVWISSLTGVAGHITEGNVKLTLLAVMLVGGLIGTNAGTKIGLKLPNDRIKFYFIFVLLLALVMVVFKLGKITFA